MADVPHHTHPISDIRGLEPRLDRLETKMHKRHPEHPKHRDKGHTHEHSEELMDGFDGKGHGHPALDHEDGDSHPAKHADHPYIASAHRFTKPAFHAKSTETMKGSDVPNKGDKSYGSY